MIVVSSEGSTPSKAGTKMAVTSQGESFGTIGGGALECSLIKKAHSLMATESVMPILCRFQHNLSIANDDSGMTCGGKQTVLLYRSHKTDIKLYRQFAEIYLNKTPGVISVTPNGFQLQLQQTLPQQTQFHLQSENDCEGASLGVGRHPFYALVQAGNGLSYRTETKWVRLTAGL